MNFKRGADLQGGEGGGVVDGDIVLPACRADHAVVGFLRDLGGELPEALDLVDHGVARGQVADRDEVDVAVQRELVLFHGRGLHR